MVEGQRAESGFRDGVPDRVRVMVTVTVRVTVRAERCIPPSKDKKKVSSIRTIFSS